MTFSDLKDRVTGVGNRVFTVIGIVAGALVAASQYLDLIPQEWRSSRWYLLAVGLGLAGAWWRKNMPSGAPPAAMLLLACALALPWSARADEATRPFGGCNSLGTICYGPTMAISLVGMDMSTGKFTAGVIPGAGYGITFFADKPYQLGLGGYAAIQTGPDTTSGLFSGIVSFANYLRVGVGWQVLGATHSSLLLLGLGTDLK